MKSLPQFIAVSSTKMILFFKLSLTVLVSVVQHHKSVITIYILLYIYLPSLWSLPPLPSPTPPVGVITALQAGLPVNGEGQPAAPCSVRHRHARRPVTAPEAGARDGTERGLGRLCRSPALCLQTRLSIFIWNQHPLLGIGVFLGEKQVGMTEENVLQVPAACPARSRRFGHVGPHLPPPAVLTVPPRGGCGHSQFLDSGWGKNLVIN